MLAQGAAHCKLAGGRATGAPCSRVSVAQDKPKYRFVISHLRDAKFDSVARLGQLQVRDLGLVAATDGAIRAVVARAGGPCVPNDTGGRHHHDYDIQLMYCLKGWQLINLGDGIGTIRIEAGTFWAQPHGLVHEILDHSDDFEILVVNLPAAFGTYPESAQATQAHPA